MKNEELLHGRGLAVEGVERLFQVAPEPTEGGIHVTVGDATCVLTVASARFLIEAVALAIGELSEALGNKYDCMEVKQRVAKVARPADTKQLAGWPSDSDVAGLPREPGGPVGGEPGVPAGGGMLAVGDDWRTEVTQVEAPGKHPPKPAHKKR